MAEQRVRPLGRTPQTDQLQPRERDGEPGGSREGFACGGAAR